MKAPENNKWLDEALEKAIRQECKPDFEKFKQAHPEVIEMLTSRAKQQPPVNIGSIIMKSKITKFAAAAVIIIAVAISITVLDKSVTPAWAIEQTIDLLRQFNAIHFSGTMLNEEGKEVSFEAWARANKEQTASNHLRIESDDGAIEVVSGDKRYQYDPATATVKTTKGYGPAIRPWPGASFLESLRKKVLDWTETYGKDPATGRNRVFVTCSHPASSGPRSWWFAFDVESKMIISLKQWENMTRQGLPSFYAKSITYLEDLPDEMFDFEIPEEAKVVPALAERNKKLQDPNAGMPIGNMTEEQACVEITKHYWQAVIEQNWQTVALLYPVETAEQWEVKYSGNSLQEIAEIGTPYQQGNSTKVKIVSCTIRFDNNVTRKINMAVFLREIDGQRSCVIANTWSSE